MMASSADDNAAASLPRLMSSNERRQPTYSLGDAMLPQLRQCSSVSSSAALLSPSWSLRAIQGAEDLEIELDDAQDADDA